MSKPIPIDGKCTNCGAEEFYLAEDNTDYSRCTLDSGEWNECFSSTQPSGAEEAVRFFCIACCVPHAVPSELTE